MSILAWILVGIIAGFIAKGFVPGEGPGGILGDLIVGIVGAVIGGFVFNLFGAAGATGLNLYSIVVAAIGAIILLGLLRSINRPRSVV